MKLSSLYSSSSFSKTRVLFIFICITIFALILDTSIDQIYYLNINESPLATKVILFMVIATISLIGQYAFLQFIRNKSIDIRKANVLYLRTLSKITYIIQSVLTTLSLIVIFQIIIEIQYNVVILMSSISISSLLGGSMMILLALKFFSWFRSDKNFVLLLYGISSTIIASNIAFTGVVVIDLLLTKPDIIQPHFGWGYSDIGSLSDLLLYGYPISSIAGFITAWISTIVLLRQFSVQWKGKAHWIIVSIPLVYFLIQFQPLFLNLFSESVRSEPVYYGIVSTLFITYSKPIGGLIFGGSFWAITKRLHRNGIMMDYTTISAFGFVILFVSNQTLLLSSASYPPFGLATVNFLGLSCYMVLVGIYSSAISISQNTKLRISIRKLVENKSNLLDSIGATQMSQFLENEVLDLYNNITFKVYDDIGVPPSISADEAKDYCNMVLKELSRSKNSGNHDV